MMFEELHIRGLRGFAQEQVLSLAKPNGSPGSGLTVLVGANSAGKSTAIEALRAICQREAPSFTQGRRNLAAGDEVHVSLTTDSGHTASLRSNHAGTSETTLVVPEEMGELRKRVLVLPARRTFDPHFSKFEITRDDYMQHIGFPNARSSALQEFTYRLFAIEKNRTAFNEVLREVLDPVPDWTIDQMDTGQYYLKFRSTSSSHSSEGVGEGLVSLLYIVDALYDSSDGNLIAIDEPELSLHPALQRKLARLITRYASTRQIVIATHSPYMVSLEAIPNGATVARVHAGVNGSKISQLTPQTATAIFGLMRNQNNPHIFGLNAQEIFFVPDKVVLVEGQDDVVFLERVQQSVGVRLGGTVFGWGVGGAENMERVVDVLIELGFSRVVGILDGNRSGLAESLALRYPDLHFFAIPADDIRTKPGVRARDAVLGLLDDANREVRGEHRREIEEALTAANAYLGGAEAT